MKIKRDQILNAVENLEWEKEQGNCWSREKIKIFDF